MVSSRALRLPLHSCLDGMQGVAAGVLRGCGLQDISFKMNLVTYWLVALPLAYFFALRFGTHVDIDAFIKDGTTTIVPGWGIRGQWVAMSLASFGLCVAVFYILLHRLDWKGRAELVAARERAAHREEEEAKESEEVALLDNGGTKYGSVV